LVVKSQTSEHVIQARSAVQEMLLLNHPVDCPICDQAGECRLQDYWLEHGATKKRMRDEPVHKPKAVVFGPTIVYDAERCIVCTRCVRVSEELAKDPVLSVRERGNLTEIVVSPGRELDHKYTLMTEYVCPVGALTSSDFRFKARVWFLRSANTICTGCATGCNAYADYDPRTQTVHRYRPRENLLVNKYWMCDDGMLDYRRIHEGRVLEAKIKGEPSSREAAVAKAAELLLKRDAKKIAIVLSAEHSQEDNVALLWLAREVLGTKNVFVSGRPEGVGDDILISSDKNANSAGVAELVDVVDLRSFSEFEASVQKKEFEVVVVLGSSIPNPESKAASLVRTLIAISTHAGPWSDSAQVLLPASSFAESDGTFVNVKGLAQLSHKVIRTQGDSKPAWRLIQDLARALGRAPSWRKVDEVRDSLSHAARSSAPPAPNAGANG
jgi:NADH-quinone oxidoreductase subunit G